MNMAVQKTLVGKLKKFPVGVRRIFALSTSSFSTDKECLLFLPYEGQENEQKSEQERKFLTKAQNVINQGSISQTYPQWKVMLDFQKLHSLHKRRQFKKRKMYILPMGPSNQKAAFEKNGFTFPCPSLFDKVIEFASLFFYGMDVELLKFLDTNLLNFTTRIHGRTNKEQVLVTDILDYLKKIKPDDCFCIVGWSLLDLYPSAELNFVLGEACFESGCAVISFGHYSIFKPEQTSGNTVDNIQVENERIFKGDEPVSVHRSSIGISLNNSIVSSSNMLECSSVVKSLSCNLSTKRLDFHPITLDDGTVWRVLKVLTHEVCHTLGMHHCTFFACLMNESSNVYQAQHQPLFLCPICLRKLQKFLRFSVVARYSAMKDYMEHYCQITRTSGEASWLHPSRDPSGKLTCDAGVGDSSSPDTRMVNREDDTSRDIANFCFSVENPRKICTLDKFEHCITWLKNALIYIKRCNV